MMNRIADNSLSISPLEAFVRDYVDARDGVWEEIEPQVYDLLIGPDMLEVAFDPEALPEHPLAQLASLGSPLFDRLLADAADRWRSARLYRIGLNLHPHDLESRLRRAISFPPKAFARIDRVRALTFPQAVFWFKATFIGDQKEEEILPIGFDLHYLRETRQLDALLSPARLSQDPDTTLPEARHANVIAGYRAAREHLVRTVVPLANARRRDWTGRVEKQIARMSAYYAQLRREAADQATRTADTSAGAARASERRESIDREEALRISELRQKSSVRAKLNLASLMVVHQPKLLINATVVDQDRAVGGLEVVWDALSESIEAVPCPSCGQSTYSFRINRTGLSCEGCVGTGRARR
jgi:hypothetical protein